METNDRTSARIFTGRRDSWKPLAYAVLTMVIAIGFVPRIWGYQAAAHVNCALPAAYKKAIAWDSTLGSGASDNYDPNIGGFGNGYYSLESDLTVFRMVLDRGTTTVFDLGDGRTLTSLGQDGSPAVGATKVGSGATVQLKSGTMLFPPSPYQGSKIYPYLSLPRSGGGGIPLRTT